MKRILLFISVVIVVFFCKCRKTEFFTESSAKLKFSVDTVIFDTVFTNIGSVTNRLKVYNPYKQAVKISSIRLAKGGNSNFRLNINGIAANKTEDIEIPAEDSIFIFVEVTVDPTNSNNPMVIQDSIIFLTNGNAQDIDLVAWGQDAHYFNGQVVQGGIWTNDKPYLIYNSIALDSGETLTIKEGVQIHFHRNSRFYAYPTSNLIVEGTKDNPVVFQGDRLESMYDDIPGQWVGIWLWGSDNSMHKIDYAIIKNAIIGIEIDTLNNLTTPSLTLSNTIIKNMNAVGLYALGSNVLAYNCVFANCGQYAVGFAIGGNYELYHCTIGNYWKYSNRTTGSVYLNNYYKDIYGVYQVRSLEKANFGNCIIYGNKENEIELDMFPGYPDYFNYLFDHCLIKVNQDIDISDISHFLSVEANKTPGFVDTEENNYELGATSEAINKGDINIVTNNTNLPDIDLTIDYNQQSRVSDIAPDIGAYEKTE